MKAIIVDDELHSRETTKMMLESVAPEISIIGMCNNARDGARLIRETVPDLVFLDIQMPEINGIQMLDLMPDYKGEIIFITAYDQYAIEAFKKGALHYLLKPLDPDDLEMALARVKKILRKESTTIQRGTWLSLSTMEGWIVVKKEDIIRCESYKNYTTITTEKASHTISKTLKEVQAKLPVELFYRVHNSHVVNISFIDKVIKSDGGNVLMRNTDIVPISKNKKALFFEWFQERIESV